MLVLTRREGERILVGENIWIEVVGIEHGRVRIGIVADRHVPIWREELLPVRNQDEPTGSE